MTAAERLIFKAGGTRGPALSRRKRALLRLAVSSLIAAASPLAASESGGPESGKPIEELSAEEACGADRRCRIERLRRVNESRRQVRQAEVGERTRRMEAHWDERSRPLREKHPFSAALRIGRLGLQAGYSLSSLYRIETAYHRYDSMSVFDLQVTHVLGTRDWSPYASAGVTAMSGPLHVYHWGRDDRGGTSTTQGTYEAAVHALRFAAGIDMAKVLTRRFPLMEWVHLRFGFVFQPHVYHRARNDDGPYDAYACESLEDKIERDFRFHTELYLGVGF